MTFLLLTLVQENEKPTSVFWLKRDSAIVLWCHPCQPEGTMTAQTHLHCWSRNCDGGTLVLHWFSIFLCAFLLQNPFLALPYHWISTSLGPFVPPTSQDLLSSCMGAQARKENTAVLQLQKMTPEVARAPVLNVCFVFSSSTRVNDQVSHTQIALTAQICCSQTHFHSKKVLAHQVSRTMTKGQGTS